MDIAAVNKINFDVCTVCNHACVFCSNRDDRAVKVHISAQAFQQVMDNLARYVDFRKITEFGLSAKGEPLVNRDFPKIVALAKGKYGLAYIYISTNGSRLTPRLAECVLEAGLDSIKFSINAITRESYRKTHGKDEFDKVLSNLKHLIELKKQRYPRLNILISCISGDDQTDIEEFYRAELREDFRLIAGVWKRDLLFTPAKYIGEAAGRAVTARCNKPFDEIWINADGHLLLCCLDYFSEVDLGSLLENDFMSLWNGPEMEHVRTMHGNGEFPRDHICRRCLTFNKNFDIRLES